MSVEFLTFKIKSSQTGDFRTRISVYDLDENERMFESERVAFQYEHNYWKLPVAMDDTSVIHTSGTSFVILLAIFKGNLSSGKV